VLVAWGFTEQGERVLLVPSRLDFRRNAFTAKACHSQVCCLCLDASVNAAEPVTPATDEVRASARPRSEPVALLHPWEGSGAAGAAEFHATR
jgi:hypothetical protein